MSDNINDYLTFKKMITPVILHILFWVLVAIAVLFGLYTMVQVPGGFVMGLLTMILGPVVIRIYVEIIMVMFKINEGVQTIAKKK